MGIGFAIPINMARDICDQLIENGSVTRGYLGIMIQELTADLAKSFDIEGTEGVLVGDVSKDSPADQAGLKSGDVIVTYDGHAVKKVGAFRNRVAHTSPDTTVKMDVLRDGKRHSLEVTIGTLTAADAAASGASHSAHSLGLTVQPLDGQLAEKLGYTGESGVVVTEVESGSKAAAAGIEPGSLIRQVNREEVSTVAEFQQALEGAGEDQMVLLLVKKGDYSRYVTLPLED
jgi:serine protease Do